MGVVLMAISCWHIIAVKAKISTFFILIWFLPAKIQKVFVSLRR
jgi:hypothetical protein